MGEKTHLELWEEEYKPEILKKAMVDINLVAKVLGFKNAESIRERMRAGRFGEFSECYITLSGRHVYDLYAIRFVKWYEGQMPIKY